MGIELVKVLSARHGGLSGRAFKVLCRMAVTALDQPNPDGRPARLYFAGEEPLALALGYDGPTPNALREVRRVLKELDDAGLIERTVEFPGRGSRRRQSFRLTLDALGGESAHPKQGESAHPKQGESAPHWVGNLPTPRTDTGGDEDLSKDPNPHPSTSTTDRTRESTEIRIDPVAPHLYAPDAYGASCDVCNLPESHQRHRRIA